MRQKPDTVDVGAVANTFRRSATKPVVVAARGEEGWAAGLLRRSHVWLGLLIGVAAIVVSLTGIALNHPEITGFGREGPPPVSGTGQIAVVQPINALLKAALVAGYERGARIVTNRGRVLPPTGPGDIDRAVFRPSTSTVQVRLRDPDHTEVILDWSTGEVLSVRPRHDIRMEQLHSGELIGQKGVVLSDIVGVVLIILAVGGVVIWLRRLRLGLASGSAARPRSAWVRWNWRFHLVGGLAITAWLVLLSVTGIILNHKREWGFMVEPPRFLPAEFVARGQPASIETIAGWALNARLQRGDAVSADDIRLVDYRPLAGYAKVRFVDADTEVIVDAYEPRVFSIAQRQDIWIEQLHSGLLFGGEWVLLSDITGLVVIAVTINGLYLFVVPGWRARGRPVMDTAP